MIDDTNADDLRQVQKALAHGGDVYRRLAAQKAGIPESEVTTTMRDSAKREAFRVLYTPGPVAISGRFAEAAKKVLIVDKNWRLLDADYGSLEERILQTCAEGVLAAEELGRALGAGAENLTEREGRPLRITYGVPVSRKALRGKAQWKQEIRRR